MIDADRPVAEPLEARRPSLGARVIVSLLGHDERQRFVRFAPYFPRFNLRPSKAPLPTSVVLAAALTISCVVALPPVFLIHQISNRTRSAIAQTQVESVTRKLAIKRYDLVQTHLLRLENERDALAQVVNGGIQWSKVMDEIRSQLPPGVKITKLEADSTGSVRIAGESYDLRSIGSFMLFLRASGHFVHPKLANTQRISRVKPEIYAYDMTLERTKAGSASLLNATQSVLMGQR